MGYHPYLRNRSDVRYPKQNGCDQTMLIICGINLWTRNKNKTFGKNYYKSWFHFCFWCLQILNHILLRTVCLTKNHWSLWLDLMYLFNFKTRVFHILNFLKSGCALKLRKYGIWSLRISVKKTCPAISEKLKITANSTLKNRGYVPIKSMVLIERFYKYKSVWTIILSRWQSSRL